MTPWHLVQKHERELVLRELERDLSCVDCPDAYRAAAALLREAAPYPDEAFVVMVVTVFGEHGPCEVRDIRDNGVLDLADLETDGGINIGWTKRACDCRPLTVGARDLLDALRGAP